MKRVMFVACATLLCLVFADRAQATVVTFDDLTGQALVPDGYGGITWLGEWTYYGAPQSPYTPNSSPNRVYDTITEGQFTFASPVTFDGAWFSGNAFATVQFAMYTNISDVVPVALSSVLAPTEVPAFLSSGYSGSVSRIGVISPSPDYFVMDDVTYNGTQETPVPEPATMVLLGSGLAGTIAQRRRKSSRL